MLTLSLVAWITLLSGFVAVVLTPNDPSTSYSVISWSTFITGICLVMLEATL